MNRLDFDWFMYREWIASLLFVACIAGCNSRGQQQATEEQRTDIRIGGERDTHGCISAAGETWSELQGRCLKLFEEGIRLDPIAPLEGEAVISAFIIYSPDSTAIELFLPNKTSQEILHYTNNGIYQSGVYTYHSSKGELLIRENLSYHISQ